MEEIKTSIKDLIITLYKSKSSRFEIAKKWLVNREMAQMMVLQNRIIDKAIDKLKVEMQNMDSQI